MNKKMLIPLVLFFTLVAVLGYGLTRDPSKVSSPLIDKPLPAFELSVLDRPGTRLASSDLTGEPMLLNVWASWCAACRVEHPLLMKLAEREAVPIYGLNYRDTRVNAQTWLERFGNPYRLTLFDPEGRAGLELGVYGAPETYLVDADGTIVYKHIGPITDDDWQNTFQPILNKLRRPSS